MTKQEARGASHGERGQREGVVQVRAGGIITLGEHGVVAYKAQTH